MRANTFRNEFDLDFLLRPIPHPPSAFAIWMVSAVIGLPLTFLVNYIVSGAPTGSLLLWPIMTWISHEACQACFSEKPQ